MDSSPGRLATPHPCPVIRLPAKLRIQLEDYVALPRQNESPDSSTWVAGGFTNVPSDSMNLLLANKRILNAFREPIYGHNCVTVTASQFGAIVLGTFSDCMCFEPLPKLPSMSYIKNMQLDLRMANKAGDNDVACDVLDMYSQTTMIASFYITDILLLIVKQIHNLETLKTKFPCLCDTRNTATSDRFFRILSATLEPLKQLRVSNKVTSIAARVMKDREASWLAAENRFCEDVKQNEVFDTIFDYHDNKTIKRVQIFKFCASQQGNLKKDHEIQSMNA
ncbi:MAG: hypothetical protein Q9218_006820 [Villophora microphyllina]